MTKGGVVLPLVRLAVRVGMVYSAQSPSSQRPPTIGRKAYLSEAVKELSSLEVGGVVNCEIGQQGWSRRSGARREPPAPDERDSATGSISRFIGDTPRPNTLKESRLNEERALKRGLHEVKRKNTRLLGKNPSQSCF